MTLHHQGFVPQSQDSTQGILKIAIMAVGGQGGGVLTGWIEAVARATGRVAQATSVAGVAQRTGATIYYIEIAPEGLVDPVFSLAPAGGDVDVLIAAEMMEAGRAIQRGFVTPDRTTLIASTHRALAVSEKSVPGDGIADSQEVLAAAEIAAQHFIAADMEALAVARGSVISASLFGALAGSGALPFERTAYEDAIRASGKGVAASLLAFDAGFEAASLGTALLSAPQKLQTESVPVGPARQLAKWRQLEVRVQALPEVSRIIATAGLRKVVDFQSVAYGALYLKRVEAIAARDRVPHTLTTEAAKYIANAMAYDDVIRVADLKTREGRFARIRTEMGQADSQLMQITEFMHPRAEEIAGLLPAWLGRRVDASANWMARLDRWFNKGRRLRTDTLRTFLLLYLLGGLRSYRLWTHRHSQEVAHLDAWLMAAQSYETSDYDLAVEVLRCRRLIKGYSDTHARGISKFDRVLEGIALVAGRKDAADWARRLREAALQDEEGKALDGALRTVRSFV